MIFHHKICPVIPKLRMKTHNHHRMYLVPNGELYPSVTTVVKIIDKEGIDDWKKRVGEGASNEVIIRSTVIGNEFHKIAETYLNNKSLKEFKNIIPLAHYNNVKEKLDNINNIYTLEATLYSDDLKIAGRVDCVAEYDHILSIIDFKTARKQKKEEWIKSYLLQETAYAEMFEFITSMSVEQIVTIISGEDGSNDVYVRDKMDYLEELKDVIEQYDKSNT